MWTRYNDIFCSYREILLRVWTQQGTFKANPVIDEIEAFAKLEFFMKDFQYNMINNIYVPAEEELDNYIDFAKYHQHLGTMINKSPDKDKNAPLDLDGNSKRIEISLKTPTADPYEFWLPRFTIDINEITEGILKLPVRKTNVPNLTLPGELNNDLQKEADELDRNDAELDKNIEIQNPDPDQPIDNSPTYSAKGSRKHSMASSAKKPKVRVGESEFQLASSKALDRLIELEAWDVKDWTEVHISKSIQVYKKKEEGSPVILIKAYTQLENIPPEKVFRLIYDLDVRNKWDTTLHNLKVFGKINENADHMYSLFKAPLGASNRDFCQRRTKSMGYKGTAFIIHFESVEHPDCPPIKGNVRAHTYISGYIIRSSQKHIGSTEMTILTQTDIKV